jgi:hypothetical protein
MSNIGTPSRISSDVPIDEKLKVDPTKGKFVWNDEIESILESWSDIASCYASLNRMAFEKFKKINTRYALPTIILSSLSGTFSIAIQGYVPQDKQNIAQLGIGLLSLAVGVLSTIQNYFRYSQNSEIHNSSFLGWSKLKRTIEIELSIQRELRKDADIFIRSIKNEYDALLEQNLPFPKDILKKFKKTFKNLITKNSKDEQAIDFVLPEILGNISHTKSFDKMHYASGIEGGVLSSKVDIIPDIKDVLLERLNSLENKIVEKPKSPEDYSITELREILDKKLNPADENTRIRRHSFIKRDSRDIIDIKRNNLNSPRYTPRDTPRDGPQLVRSMSNKMLIPMSPRGTNTNSLTNDNPKYVVDEKKEEVVLDIEESIFSSDSEENNNGESNSDCE